jgi:hypothetical protein
VPHHTDDPAERARRMSVLQRTEATFEPLPFNTAAALTFGLVSAAVVVAGHKPRHRIVDLMIASIAITNRLPLLPPTPAISPAWTSSRQFPQRRGCDQPDAERTKDCMRRRLLLELEYYSSNTSGKLGVMGVSRLSISVPPEAEDAIRVAAEAAGLSISVWLAPAAEQAAIADGLAAVAEFEAEDGTLTDAERAEARQALSDAGVIPPRRAAS